MMWGGLLALAAVTMSGQLAAILAKTRTEASEAQVSQIGSALQCSPTLNKYVAKLASAKRLRTFHVVPATAALHDRGFTFRGWQQDGSISLKTDFLAEMAAPEHRMHTLDYSRNNPNDLTFSLGLIASHLANADRMAAFNLQIKSDIGKGVAAAQAAGTPFDITTVLKRGLDGELENDAAGWMLGWNSTVECARNQKGSALSVEEIVQLSLKTRYGQIIGGAWGAKVVTTPDGKVPDFPANRAAFAASLRNVQVTDIK